MRTMETLPALPATDITLFVADQVNEATQRLAQTIQASPQYRGYEQPAL